MASLDYVLRRLRMVAITFGKVNPREVVALGMKPLGSSSGGHLAP
jgi:hypothetical protein